jgi:tetratricopeptide (TPR) repeat protein
MKNRSPKRLSKNARIEMHFLECLQQRLPDNIRVLEGLLQLNNFCGRYDEGLRIAQHVVAMIPKEADAWYNLASCYAMTGRKTEAIAALARAIHMGYDDYRWIMADRELLPLRGDPRFKRLLTKIKQFSTSR